MAQRRLVSITGTGRLTIPATARRELGIADDAQFEVEVDAGTIILRPVIVLPREDAWAYTTEHRRLLTRAHRDSREGRVRRLSERDLARLTKQRTK